MSSPQQGCETSNKVCLICRQRKVRCDRRRPRCGFCRKNDFECEYSTSHRTPGLRAGYVAKLESRIESLELEFTAFKTHVNDHILHATASAAQLQPTPGVEALANQELVDDILFEKQPSSQNETDYLSPQSLSGYCHVWFDQYHSWFPVLHQPTILEFCEKYTPQAGDPASLILKAIAVVILTTQDENESPTSDRKKLLLALSDEIVLAAIRRLSLRTLQALLILTIAEYGTGRLMEFWNLISLCKRMSTQLGLRDLVAHNCINFGFPSIIPPRMLTMPLTAVDREEKIRAFWAIEALDSASTLGAAWHLSIPRPEPAASLPCDEEIWRYPESVIAMYQFGNAEVPSSYSLYVRLVTNELWHVHNFLQQSYDATSVEESIRRQEECDLVYQKLVSWQSDFEQLLTVHTPMYADLFSACDTPTQHPNTVLIQCTLHSAIISLYQRSEFSTINAGGNLHKWEHAAERCLSSCDQMAEIVRKISEQTLEASNPYLVFCIFIAARFYIIYTKAVKAPLPNKLYLFIYALRVCGQRWPLARQLHKVLEAAVAECSGTTGRAFSALPAEFYDLQYFSLDIQAALREWAQEGIK